MSDYIDINGADYVTHVHTNGETFYIGEESILDDTKREIGFVCSRGPDTIVAATDYNGNIIADRWFRGDEGEALETEDDVIDVIRSLHEGQ